VRRNVSVGDVHTQSGTIILNVNVNNAFRDLYCCEVFCSFCLFAVLSEKQVFHFSCFISFEKNGALSNRAEGTSKLN